MLTLIGSMHVLPVVIVQRSIELLQGLNDMSPEEMTGLGIDQRLPDWFIMVVLYFFLIQLIEKTLQEEIQLMLLDDSAIGSCEAAVCANGCIEALRRVLA